MAKSRKKARPRKKAKGPSLAQIKAHLKKLLQQRYNLEIDIADAQGVLSMHRDGCPPKK